MKLTLISAGIELKKIFARKKYKITLFIQLALCFLFMFFISSDTLYTQIGVTFDVPTMPQLLLNALCSVVLPLHIFMLSADLFANEIENGTIRSVLLRPISRFKIYLSKVMAITYYILINLAATVLVIVIAKLIAGAAIPQELTELMLSYFLAIVPMIVFITMASFISLLLANSSLAMFCSLILYIAMQGITLWSSPIGAVFFTSHLGWYKMFLGLSFDWATIANTFFLFVSSAVLLAIGGSILFERREV